MVGEKTGCAPIKEASHVLFVVHRPYEHRNSATGCGFQCALAGNGQAIATRRHLNGKAATAEAPTETELGQGDKSHQFGPRVTGGEFRLEAAHQFRHLGCDGEKLNAHTLERFEAP